MHHYRGLVAVAQMNEVAYEDAKESVLRISEKEQELDDFVERHLQVWPCTFEHLSKSSWLSGSLQFVGQLSSACEENRETTVPTHRGIQG